MPKRATFKPVHVPGREKPWKIDMPASISSTGHRARYFFESKQDAINFADEQKIRLKNYGTAGLSSLSPSQAEQAVRAFSVLDPHGVTLNEVIEGWLARRNAAEKTVTFKEGFRQFEQHLALKKIKGRPVSESYRRQVKYTFPRFPALHDRPLTEIDARMIAHATEGMKPSAKNSFLRVLSALFSWCAEVPRQWMKENPAQNVPKDSVGGAEVETFTPDETARILDACVRVDESLLPYHVLGFFAGIRPEELERTQWEFINLDENAIVLPAQATKTGKRRVVEIDDTLAAWLRWIMARHGIQQGPIVSPINLRKRLRAVREEAKVTWIQDGMRQSYASNWLAIHKDEHRLRDNLGHKSADELWDHYHKAVTAKFAKKFWEVLPPAETKVITFEQKGVA
jgi:integrase